MARGCPGRAHPPLKLVAIAIRLEPSSSSLLAVGAGSKCPGAAPAARTLVRVRCCLSCRSPLRSWDKLRVCLFLQTNPRCNVRREDCGPRREGAAAHTGQAGRVVKEVAAAAAPSPTRLAVRQLTITSGRVARDPRRVHRWKGACPHASHHHPPRCPSRRHCRGYAARGRVRRSVGHLDLDRSLNPELNPA
jgi:hypothetical protein